MAYWKDDREGEFRCVVSGLDSQRRRHSLNTLLDASLPIGHVRVAKHAKTGEYAAVKIVSKHALVNSRMSMAGVGEEEDKILMAIEREIVIMKLIDHPNVLSLYDVWETKSEL